MTEKYEIFDVDVMTVGLVGKGANDEEFLLLKSDDNSNSDPDSVEKGKVLSAFLNRKISQIMEKEGVSRDDVVDRLVKATGLKRDTIFAVLDNTIGRPPNKRLIQMGHVLGVPFDTMRTLADVDREGSPRNLQEDLNKGSDDSLDDMEVLMTDELEHSEDIEETQEDATTDTVNVDELVENALQEKGEGVIRKVLKTLFAVEPDTEVEPEKNSRDESLNLVKSLYEERIAKAEQDRDALLKSVSEIQKQLDDEKDRRAKMEWFEKAKPITSIPVKRMDIAEKLHAMSKTDAEMANWMLDLLKTVDTQLHEAGLFQEMGTTKYNDGQVDVLAKMKDAIQKGDIETPRDFLLGLTPDEQRKILAGV